MQCHSSSHSDKLLPPSNGTGRQPPTPREWAAVKEIVHRLYVEEELPLREVKNYLETHNGFRASERMFKDRLKKWSFQKNLTKEDWEALAVLHARRKADGKRSTCFYVKERRKSVRDLQKYSRSQGLTEDSLAATAGADVPIPRYLRAITPDHDTSPGTSSPATDFRQESSPSSHDSMNSCLTTITDLFVFPSPEPQMGSVRSTHLDTGLLPQEISPLASDKLQARMSLLEACAPPSLSPASSGSASQAMTGSTMATSINSDGPSLGPTTDSSSPWNFRSNAVTSHAEDPLAFSWDSDSLSIPSSCDNISRDLEIMSHQLTDPAPLLSRYGDDDIMSWMLLDHPEQGQDPNDLICSCSVCHQPSAAHFVSIHNTVPQQPPRSILNDSDADRFGVPSTTKEEGAWRWIALCFAACLSLKKPHEELSAKILSDASTELEKLVSRRDRLLLTAANQMITILHMHNQGQIAVTITSSAKHSIDRMLPNDDPIRITFNYLAAAADSSSSAGLENSGITSSTLYSVYQKLEADPKYGSQHPYTVSASYNYAWLLRYEGQYQEAEQQLLQTYRTSCSIFGRNHMQSITAIATLAGAQFGQKKTSEVIENFKIAIRDCKPTLGKSHPYRLEAKRRLALQYEALGRMEKMVPLYWEILAGRVRMLGATHTYTLGQQQDYEDLMRELGRWDEPAQREVEALFAVKRKSEQEATRRRRSGSNSSHGSESAAF